MTIASSHQSPASRTMRHIGACGALLAASLAVGGCAVGAGIAVPIVPGISLSLGVGPGGPALGINTGWGPLGAGVGINHLGQVYASAGAGLGVGVGVGGVGVGVGKSVILHDPQASAQSAIVVGAAPLGSPGNPIAP
ncbi:MULTISPECIES: hypothetical protein [unclassified Variovorax]|uniref:hypothetical protein n=1 Tax=unclassified Variovorax TaxID=663243 RepID=UPI001BD4BE04|nr:MULTISPECIES: hypothetical protein [unclassified Variovorax]